MGNVSNVYDGEDLGMAWEGKKRIDWMRLWPMYWLQNERTDWEWDAILNDLLDKHEPMGESLTVKVGKVEVWVGNWPYAYGSPYGMNVKDVLPSVRTRKRLRDSLPNKDNLAGIRGLLDD
jgi:hypothetical protein